MSSCLILRSNDQLHLNSMFSLNASRGKLYDRHLDVTHTVTSEGATLIGALINGNTYKQLRMISIAQNISEASLKHLLTELARCGALKHKKIRSSNNTIQAICVPSYSWRRDASLAAITLAVIRAMWKLCLTMLLLAAGAAACNLLPLYGAISIGCWLIGLFLISATLHEWSHVLFLQTKEVQSSVIQQGYRVGVLHQRIPPVVDGICALIGPLAGGTSAVLLALCSRSQTVLHASFIIVFFHACSLLPNYGDGRSIMRALRFYKRKKS